MNIIGSKEVKKLLECLRMDNERKVKENMDWQCEG